MIPGRFAAVVVIVAAGLCSRAVGQPQGAAPAGRVAIDFEGGVPAGARVQGDAAVVAEPVHGGAKALRVEPGAVVELPVAGKPSYGEVTVWAYDSGATLPNEKDPAFGPLVGLMDPDGGVVVYGRIWAAYLAGNTGYGYINSATSDWFSRRWAGGTVSEGWHKWTFSLAPDGAMEVKLDDRGVHYESAELPLGFKSVVVYGSKENATEAAVVDDIAVSIEGEMRPSVIERHDLPGEHHIPFRKELIGKHPRLFFAAQELPALRERCQTTHRRFFDAAVQYGLASLTLPEGEPWLNNDTDAQRWGWWKMPTIAFLAVLSDDARYRSATKDLLLAICKSRHFQEGEERDCGMGAANVLAGAAIGYDVVYDDLTPEERKLVQDKLWLQIDRLYENGFMEKLPGAHYWQQDPQNNHRWHRMAGLMLACLALYGDVPEVDGYLDYAIQQAREIVKWLPEDGSNHESAGYQAFGTQYLVPLLWALQRCTDVDLLTRQEGIRNLPHFRAHMVLPGGTQVWDYADGGRSVGWFNHYHFKCASLFRDPYAQALHLANYAAAPQSYDYQCWNTLFFDPTLEPADLSGYPTYRYFPDIEIAAFRQSWTDPNALAAFFKCGPYGGHALCRYRTSFPTPHYVNVAHDHPDAGGFMVFWRGQFFAMDSGYTHTRNSTADHNSILVNGKGQAGEGEGAWTQPIDDMESRARIAQFFGAPGYGVVRGEAAAFYDDLRTFDRTLLYVDDSLIVVHDNIAAKTASTIDWLYGCDGEWQAIDDRAYEITKGGAKFRVSLLAPDGIACSIGPHVADGGRGEEKTQLKATLDDVTSAQIIALLAPQSEAPATCSGLKSTEAGTLMRFRSGGSQYDVLVRRAPGELTVDGLSTDAETAIIAHKGGAPTAVLIVGGSRVEAAGLSVRLTAAANMLVTQNGATAVVRATTPLGGEAGEVGCSIRGMAAPITRMLVNGREVKCTARDQSVEARFEVPTCSEVSQPSGQ